MIFIEPIGSVLPPVAAEWARLSFFLMEGALFSWLFDERRRALAAGELLAERRIALDVSPEASRWASSAAGSRVSSLPVTPPPPGSAAP